MEFEEIYRRHFRDVYVFLMGLSGDPDVAQEMTQETFLKALKAIRRFDGAKDIRAWLFTIARNSYFSYLRKRSHEAGQALDENSLSEGPSVEEQFMNEEEALRIHQYLHTMEEPYREVFSLRVFGELPFEKIGSLFGKNANWARVTYYRAKKKIQKYMEAVNHE